MQSKAATVDEYLKSLPDDRRAALTALRKVFLKNLDKDFQEGMGYGMMGYSVPHSIYPAGYHCDPRQPLPFAGMASQKQHMSLYMMCLYSDAGEKAWFEREWKKSGKKLDMGKSCIRFKSLDDLPLDLIGEALARVSVKKYIATYEKLLGTTASGKKILAKNAAAAKSPGKKTAKAKAKAK